MNCPITSLSSNAPRELARISEARNINRVRASPARHDYPMSSGFLEMVSKVSGPMGPRSAVRDACVRSKTSAALRPVRDSLPT